MKRYWVYILEVKNGSFYTGYTTDLKRRFQEHLKGTKSSKYTRAFGAVKILQSWSFKTKSEAMKVEAFIKKQPRQTKKKLIKNPKLLAKLNEFYPSLPFNQRGGQGRG